MRDGVDSYKWIVDKDGMKWKVFLKHQTDYQGCAVETVVIPKRVDCTID